MSAGGEHGDHDIGAARGIRGGLGAMDAALRRRIHGGGAEVIAPHLMPGLGQVARHGQAHIAETNETDACHGRLLLLREG